MSKDSDYWERICLEIRIQRATTDLPLETSSKVIQLEQYANVFASGSYHGHADTLSTGGIDRDRIENEILDNLPKLLPNFKFPA